MKPSRTLAALGAGLLLLAACKKENDSAVKKLLMDGRWQVTASTATTRYNGRDTTIDLFSTWEECEKDDFVEFKSNGKAIHDDGPNRCPEDPQVGTGKYTLLDNDTRIAIIDDNPDTFALQVTPAELTISKTAPNSAGTIFHFVETYKNIK